WQVTLALRTSEIVGHHTEFSGDHGLYTQTFAFVMNQEAYDRLPDDLRTVIDANSGIEWAGRFAAGPGAGDVVALYEAVVAGASMVTLDAYEAVRSRAAAQATIDDGFAGTEAVGMDGRALHERAMELVVEEMRH